MLWGIQDSLLFYMVYNGFTEVSRNYKASILIALLPFVSIIVSGSLFLFVAADPLQFLQLGDPFLSRFSCGPLLKLPTLHLGDRYNEMCQQTEIKKSE